MRRLLQAVFSSGDGHHSSVQQIKRCNFHFAVECVYFSSVWDGYLLQINLRLAADKSQRSQPTCKLENECCC